MQTRTGTHHTACTKGELCLPATSFSRPLRCNKDAIGRCLKCFRRGQAFRAVTRKQIKCHGESDADRPNASTALPLSTVCDVLLLLKVLFILSKLLIFTDAALRLVRSSKADMLLMIR